uniref:Putative secreted protein n=1 Tax=Anopheles triannulatus TaxID=58253 RepID=A0A2M4B4K3_9DIPT
MRWSTYAVIAVTMTAGSSKAIRAGVGTKCYRTSRRAKTIKMPSCSRGMLVGSTGKVATRRSVTSRSSIRSPISSSKRSMRPVSSERPT